LLGENSNPRPADINAFQAHTTVDFGALKRSVNDNHADNHVSEALEKILRFII
jgi:hypothetical protein